MNVLLRRFLFSSLSIWAVVAVFGVYFLMHIKERINFGVDLVGGTYIVLEVQVEKAIEDEILHRMNGVTSLLKKNNRPEPTSTKITDGVGYLEFSDAKIAREAEEFLITQGARIPEERSGGRLEFRLASEEAKLIEREALIGNIRVLENRLNPYGAGEISIVPQGDRKIVIELPNVHDVRKAKSMIGKTALLEMKLVENTAGSEAEILAQYGGELPEHLMIVRDGLRRGSLRYYYVVSKHTNLTGRMLQDAAFVMGGETGTEPVVKFEFKPEGAELFYELTSKNIGRTLAVILDNEMLTAARIRSAIHREGTIQGSYTPETAQETATMLKSGAFVAPVTFEEERHIGPSLGRQSIRNGLLACLIGLLLLFIFALVVYKTAGLLSFIVLLFNIVLVLFALSWFNATLTLPSIAGMLLTVGMAIDASILIYERIKEELARGMPFKKAVNLGFAGALTVILDSNITNFLVAVVLYKLGAGPIRGFAITMIIGILSTLLTGIVLLKSIFNFLIDGLGVKKIRI